MVDEQTRSSGLAGIARKIRAIRGRRVLLDSALAAPTTIAHVVRKLDVLEESVAALDADSRRQFKELRALVFSLALPPSKEQ